MKTFSKDISYLQYEAASSGYAYSTIVVPKTSIYQIYASLGITYNNDDYHVQAHSSIYFVKDGKNVFAVNLSTNTGRSDTSTEIYPMKPVIQSEFVLEQGTHTIHYGVRKVPASGFYVAVLSIILTRIQSIS